MLHYLGQVKQWQDDPDPNHIRGPDQCVRAGCRQLNN